MADRGKNTRMKIEIWACFLDFQKASESVEHKAIWEALARQGIDKDYIELLKRLYANQLGKINVVSQTSRTFGIGRGTKQGDPLSTLLFNAVLEDIFRDVRDK